MLTLIGSLIVAYFVYVLISRKYDKPSTDPPAMAHAALREIIERAAEEARKLPGLSRADTSEYPREERPIAEHSYEDLLATAILNKVIERCQRDTQRVDGNSNVLRDTDSPTAKYITTEHSLDDEATSHNGDRGASAAGENEDGREPMSFMMEERIEEVTTITSNNELRGNNVLEFRCIRRVPFPEFGIDIVDPPQDSPSPSSSSSEASDDYPHIRTRRHVADHTMDLVSPVESWEDNWLFQRKRTSGSSQPDPVAMLVPSSNADYKALIGDKDAEDTSDLSECSSTRSDEEIEKELLEAINNVVPKSSRTYECNAQLYQAVPSVEMQLGKDKIIACRTNMEKIEIACEKINNDDKDKSLEVSEEKTVKDEENERKRSKGSSLITAVTAEEKTKDKSEDTRCDGRATAIEGSVNNVKVDYEKSSERNERIGNVTDENEEQRESEYTEHYDIAIQRHLDSLTKVDACSEESETSDETRKIADTQHGEPENEGNNLIVKQKFERSEVKVQLSYAAIGEHHTIAENDRLSAPPRPGTIAEREHKKWENAPPIENNPYSEESIRKRCLERQYSRSSDISGPHYELARLNEVNLDSVLLVPDRSDIKRFGRDYYINQSKSASGERRERARSAVSSVSSRPSSSLSQRSSCCISDEQQREQQDDPTSNETDGVSVLREDRDVTTASWRKNNIEVISSKTNNGSFVVTADLQRDKNENYVETTTTTTTTTTRRDHRQQADDILENKRKNSKNEINAKLNNQELETERKDEKERKIRRIDLKAYGFENEFPDQREKTARQQRAVNRLDLSSYGYEDGVLRRARSNIQLNRPLRNEKSNLTKWAIEHSGRYKGYVIDVPKSLDCVEFTSSRKNHNEFRNVGSRLISAKSMPNVTDDCSLLNYKTSLVRENWDKRAARNLTDRAIIDRSEEDEMMDECSTTDDCSLLNSYDEISSDVDRSFEDIYAKSKDQLRRQVSEEFRMLPSVKRLAEVFGRRQTSQIENAMPAKVNRISEPKTDNTKERSSTLEVQVVETPRQMHSLTARSLSKEFREGLRQMPGKVTSPPVSRSVIEERSASGAEVVRSKREGNDTAVISLGNLKSNIIFWEQMQKRSRPTSGT